MELIDVFANLDAIFGIMVVGFLLVREIIGLNAPDFTDDPETTI